MAYWITVQKQMWIVVEPVLLAKTVKPVQVSLIVSQARAPKTYALQARAVMVSVMEKKQM